MSERIFGTEKVDNIIGLKDQKVYDKIDIFSDVTNNNNLWGMLYYTEYKNHKPIQKQEIIRFQNNKAMLDFLKTNFDSYELDHPVDINHKRIFFHYVDYCSIDYYYHNGKPDLDYLVIRVFEYVNNNRVLNNIRLPKEYEQVLVSVFKVNKGMPGALPPKYHRDIDAYEEKSNNRKEIIQSITMSIEEFFKMAGNKIRNIVINKKTIKRITVLVSTVALASLLANGYNLVMDNEYNSDYLVQKGRVSSVEDINLYLNKGKVGKIIEHLMNGDYQSVSPEDMEYTIGFIRNLNDSNFDNNGSFNSFSFGDYFNYKLDDSVDFLTSMNVLKKIESLYNECFKTIDGKVTLIPSNVDSYITYVSSLSFLYDTYHSDRSVSYVKVDTQSIASPYAVSKEIETFDKFPPILRYLIMNQLRGILIRSNYELKVKPSYYFGETDKYSLLTALDKKIDNVVDSMYYNCGYGRGTRAGK